LIILIEVLHVAYVAVRGAELFCVKLPKASQHNFILSDAWYDLSRPCDQILEFASAGPKCHNGGVPARPDAKLVIDAIRQVVEAVRGGDRQLAR
jgi:hypothetical protein